MNTRILYWVLALLWLSLSAATSAAEKCGDDEAGVHQSAAPERFETVQEVVDYIMSVAPPQHLKTLKKHSKYSFLSLNFKLDDDFDRRLALKDGNTALLKDAGTKSPNRAWRTIRIAFWEALQKLE
tara:strand:+ start:414 stop:791 length:378 start_codon:yes stop_codon:yes gene_type:complete